MFKKFISVLLVSAVISTTAVTAAAAPMETATVESSLYAGTIEWNGKTKLQAGKKYTVSKNITVSKKITIPSKTTVTVKNGAKLWVSSKGSLYVKGTLEVKKGGTLAVTGTLYEYSGKNINNYGTVSFSSKAKVTINGKLNNKSTGVIKGTPKTLKVGDKAVLTNSGKNSTKKLTQYIDRTAIDKMLTTVYDKVAVDMDLYGGLKAGMSKQALDEMDAAMMESIGMSFKEYSDLLMEEYQEMLKDEGYNVDNVKSVDVKITKLTEVKTLTGDFLTSADHYYKNRTVMYELDMILTLYSESGAKEEQSGTVTVVCCDGKWYILG